MCVHTCTTHVPRRYEKIKFEKNNNTPMRIEFLS